MSRVGKQPIPIPPGVNVKFEGTTFTAQGPKGELSVNLNAEVQLEIQGEQILITVQSASNIHKSLHGLARTMVNNIIIGVTEGFEKKLEIVGVGYRAESIHNRLKLSIGYSHPIIFAVPEGIQIEVPSPTIIAVKGIDKHLVGQIAAKIRSFKPPEPYKGKGIRYAGEYVRKKAGKAAA